MRVEPDKPIKLPGGTLIGDHDPKAQSDLPFVCEEVERTYQAEIERLEAERDQALQCLVRIHTWAGRTLAATPDVGEEQFKSILEDIYAEADERVKLDG